MKLPFVKPFYNSEVERVRNREIERADRENHKRNRDVEVGAGRLILTSPNGTRYEVTVADDGTLGTSAL